MNTEQISAIGSSLIKLASLIEDLDDRETRIFPHEVLECLSGDLLSEDEVGEVALFFEIAAILS